MSKTVITFELEPIVLKTIRLACLSLLAGAGALHATAACAAPYIIQLVRASLDNESDAGGDGLWQYEGGAIENAAGSATIGHYLATRRVTTSGTSTDNAAAETITLLFSSATPGNAPNNVTLEGAYSYTSGQFAGSVSAVSARYRPLLGVDSSGVVGTSGVTKLTINLTGTDLLP